MKIAVIVLAVLLVLLAAGGGGLYAYDGSREDLIAHGVTVGGVDVGGMTFAQARAAVHREVLPRLEEPLVLEHDGRGVRFVSAGALGVSVDVESRVRTALTRSREGNFLERALRDLTGDGLDAEVPLRVDYSRKVVSELVSQVRRDLDRAPRDAKAFPTATSVRIEPSQDGLAVRPERLERVIVTNLVAPDRDRLVEVPTRAVRPKTTTADLRSRFRHFIAVSRSRFELRLYVDLELAKTYPISVGQVGYDTPSGLYRIKNKAENPTWYVPDEPWAGDLAGEVIPPGPDNPIKARWLGIYDGAGIHGTDDAGSIGSAASHGCIRMRIPDVIELSDRVPVGARVFIG